MAQRQTTVERSRASARDDCAATVVNCLLEKERGQRRADARLKERHPRVSMLELPDRMNAVLGVQMANMTGTVLGCDPAHHVAEEAEDGALGHVDLFARGSTEVDCRLDERAVVRVEFQNRICVGAKTGTGYRARQVRASAAGDC
jgi:hypothetical protein